MDGAIDQLSPPTRAFYFSMSYLIEKNDATLIKVEKWETLRFREKTSSKAMNQSECDRKLY